MEQRSNEWHELRKGKFTGSEIWKLMTEPRSKSESLSDTAKSYIYEKIVEQYKSEINLFSNQATDWGIENEPLAKRWYEKTTGKKIIDIAYVEFPGLEKYAGGSPDGIVDYKQLIEIKCPFNSANHLRNVLTSADEFKQVLKEYYWQVQFYMACLNVDSCDFISFDPRINADFGLHIKTIGRNEKDIEQIKNKIELAVELKTKIEWELNETNTN